MSWQASRTPYIRIPMYGKVESLNAAIASAVLMYEVQRQRRILKDEWKYREKMAFVFSFFFFFSALTP